VQELASRILMFVGSVRLACTAERSGTGLSALSTRFGVEWWAYPWQGNRLAVKSYYPGVFGTGIRIGSEPAHVFINFNVTTVTDWKADVTLVYQTHFNGPLYPKGHVESAALGQTRGC
jgi:hypothetical protein